jgi:hypothetical protein
MVDSRVKMVTMHNREHNEKGDSRNRTAFTGAGAIINNDRLTRRIVEIRRDLAHGARPALHATVGTIMRMSLAGLPTA